MQTRPLYLALLLASLCTGAHATLNKCKGANGHPVYQNAPCPPPASAYAKKMPTLAERNALVKQQKLEEKERERYPDGRPGANWDPGRKASAPMPPPAPAPLPAPVQPGVPAQAKPASAPGAATDAASKKEKERQLASDKVEADNAKIRAKNKAIECDNERKRQAVMKEGRPAYTTDSKGNRNFISDQQRDAELADAERRIARACR
ncbi:hypothetical protein HF313_20370 [Massilia atriviolacea]|uniref:DUF4124 domain-containing protein n=1 Tax=Massilia atriviolacea TaxID=2495579 RepID=A0A430HS50_9BURK|nr:hypothetical protein [Massilia atriviolacea]RSZ60346.1 hypothetical protein EJB06_04330 [Massilia atriviolacea]